MIGGVIDSDVVLRLKETHLANLFGAHARGSNVGDRARSEFNSSVGCVHSIGENWNADGVDTGRFDVLAHQPLYDIEIVNHQIENDVDVQRSRSELTDAMNLKINRVLDVRSQGNQRR